MPCEPIWYVFACWATIHERNPENHPTCSQILMRRAPARSQSRKSEAARHSSTLINNTFNEAGDMAVCDGCEIE